MNAGFHMFRSCLQKVTSTILAHTEVSSEGWLSCDKVTSTILADTEVLSECWLSCVDTDVCTQMSYHISYSRLRSDSQMRNLLSLECPRSHCKLNSGWSLKANRWRYWGWMAGHIDLRSSAVCRLWPACSLLLLLIVFTYFPTTCSEAVAESNWPTDFRTC